MSGERVGTGLAFFPAKVDEGGTRLVDLDALLAGAREIVIVHKGERYRLRVTQNGKLILTK